MKKKMIFMIALGLLSCNQHMGAFYKKQIENMHKMRQDVMAKVAKAQLEGLRKVAYKMAEEVFGSGSMKSRSMGDEIERATTKKELIGILEGMKKAKEEMEKAKEELKKANEKLRKSKEELEKAQTQASKFEALRNLTSRMARDLFPLESRELQTFGDEIKKAKTEEGLNTILEEMKKAKIAIVQSSNLEELRQLAYEKAELVYGSGSMRSRWAGDEIERATTVDELMEMIKAMDKAD